MRPEMTIHCPIQFHSMFTVLHVTAMAYIMNTDNMRSIYPDAVFDDVTRARNGKITEKKKLTSYLL